MFLPVRSPYFPTLKVELLQVDLPRVSILRDWKNEIFTLCISITLYFCICISLSLHDKRDRPALFIYGSFAKVVQRSLRPCFWIARYNTVGADHIIFPLFCSVILELWNCRRAIPVCQWALAIPSVCPSHLVKLRHLKRLFSWPTVEIQDCWEQTCEAFQ